MRLYDCSTAPSPRRVRIFAAEKNLSIEMVQVDLGSGEQFSEQFKAVNPECVVPALELDDGTHLTEVIAICQYLEEVQPEPSLFGASPKERAVTTMWNTKAEMQFLWAVAESYRNFSKGLQGHALPGPAKYEQIPELVDRGRRRVAEFMQKMNGRLAENEFLCGERFTIADITALVAVDFAARIKIDVEDSAVNLQRWYSDVAARPSASA
ncbi:MAG: glutathione S-transferase family protein [Woeseiaceae bacterium]